MRVQQKEKKDRAVRNKEDNKERTDSQDEDMTREKAETKGRSRDVLRDYWCEQCRC